MPELTLPTLDNYLDPNKKINEMGITAKPQDITTTEASNTPKAFQAPTSIQSAKIAYSRADPDDLITYDQLQAIDSDWKLVIPDDDNRRASYTLLARAAYDNGTSPFTIYKGTYVIDGKEFKLSDLAAVVRTYATMRQYGRYWAKTIYSLAIHDQEPPSKWMKQGFSFNTRYAAFDFFDGLSSNHTPPPKGIPERHPSDAEIAANLTARQIALARSTNKLKNLNPEVNGGGLCTTRPTMYTTGSCPN